MSDSKRFVGRRAMLGLGVTGLAAGMSRQASAASGTALDALAARLEALAADGLDPRHYDLRGGAVLPDRDALMLRAEAGLRDVLLGRVASLPGRVDIKRDAARARYDLVLNRLGADIHNV